MALTEVPIELSSAPGIVDNSTGTAITIDASGNLLVGTTTHHDFSGNTTEITVGTTATGATAGGAVTFGSGSGFLGYLGFQESEGTLGTLTSVPLVLKTGNTEAMRIDSTGNVGIGVIPSDWSTVTALQVGNAHVGALVDNAYFGANCYYDGSNWRYIATNEASRVELTSGEVQFWNAPSGTAGSVLSQTQAMTLDASGRLSINTTAATELLNIANTSGNGAGVEFAGNGNTVGSTSAFYGQGSGNDAYVWNRANSTLLFGTNNTERMRMFSNGDLSLGTSSRTFAATDRTCFEISGADNSLFALSDTFGGSLENRFYIHNDRGNGLITYLSQDGNDQRWYSGNSERMRLTNSGFFKAQGDSSYVGATGTYHELNSQDAGVILYMRNTNASGYGIILNLNNSNNTQYFFNGYSDSAGATRITIHTSGNIYNTNGTYGTLSDIKLKQDVVDAASQWDDIKDLRVRKFHMKDDPDGPLQLGLIAQEVEETSPGLVEELVDRDSENNDLGTTTKAVKYSILYMKAVKALQEAMDRIETLEAKVEQLEGAN